jgi:flagellar biosynthetic protein FliR
MEVITDTQIALFVQQFFLPFARIGALLMTMPVIGTRVVPARARIIAAFFLTIMVVPFMPPLQVAPSLSLGTLILVLHEILIGVALGFGLQVVFQVCVLAGQYLAMKMGLGFASMNDPTNGVQTTVLSQFFLVLVTLTFVVVNGHLLLIELLLQSFRTLPPTRFQFEPAQAFQVVNLGGWLFASALVISLPVLTALLVVNMAFGIMSRAAPQLNIFAVGFPFTLMCGMLLVWLGLGTFGMHFEEIFAAGFVFAHELLRITP